MKIKLTKDALLEDGQHKAGEIVDVIAEIAKQLLATGGAELPGVISQPVVERVIEKIEALEDVPVIVPGRKGKKERKHAG